MKKEDALAFLHDTVKPSLGCTEPACGALCAAAAANILSGEITGITMTLNPGLYKNGMSVAIPGFERTGMDYAAALGALIKDTKKELQIFEEITPEISKKACNLVEEGKVQIKVDRSRQYIYAFCEVKSENETATAIIKDSHTNLVFLAHNGQVSFKKPETQKNDPQNTVAALCSISLKEISSLVDTFNLSELEFLINGLIPNDTLSAYGKEHPGPVGITSAMNACLGHSELEEMMTCVGAAIEARLDGCPFSVTSSAGAGSKGLALSIPLSIAARREAIPPLQLARALAFGHLVNSYCNAVIGKLSSMCTCAVAASTAASAALVKLWGGTEEQMGFAIRNMTGTVSGMICDGGKTGCAMKLSTATAAAYLSAKMAINSSVLRESDGICAASPEDNIKNIARIANTGMANVDEVILDIMLSKKSN